MAGVGTGGAMRDVKRDELRWMLKRVAMGLAVSPLALIAACSCQTGGGGCPPLVEVQPVTQAQLDALGGADCLPLCRPPQGFESPPRTLSSCQRTLTAAPDAFALDAGGADVGPATSSISCSYTLACRGGRRPAAGITSLQGQGVATWLAELAQLKAASVDAFAELRAELIAHQAPSRIIAATSRAEADEVMHAQLIGSFARRAGAKPVRPVVSIGAPRALFDIAKHNASEGCVREAFGAINALHQASNAATAELREGFLRIARDEARHALLSLELDDWMRTRLSAHEVHQLEEERAVASAELVSHVGNEDGETRAVLGLPDEERGRDLVLMCA